MRPKVSVNNDQWEVCVTGEPIADGLYVEREGEIRLIAGRRKADGRMRFPMPTGAEAANFDPVELSPRGRLWSYTVQRFRPKTPPYIADDDAGAKFQPFALGYVEFPGQVIVEGRIAADPNTKFKIGQPMKVVAQPFATTRGETNIYAFAPEEMSA